MVGEFYSSQGGIAHDMFFAGTRLDTAALFLDATLITIIALIAFRVMRGSEGRFLAWRPEGNR